MLTAVLLWCGDNQVITKTARLPDVCEFVMNEAEFQRRAETNTAMFRDKITRRNPGKSKKTVRGGCSTDGCFFFLFPRED